MSPAVIRLASEVVNHVRALGALKYSGSRLSARKRSWRAWKRPSQYEVGMPAVIWRTLVVNSGRGRDVCLEGLLVKDDRFPSDVLELDRLREERENVEVRLEITFIVRDLVRVPCSGGPGGIGPRRR